MKNPLKAPLLLVLVAVLAGSCQKNDPLEAPAAQAATARATSAGPTDWAATLAAAQPFRDFISTGEKLLSADEAYYNGLSATGQAARRAALQAAYKQGVESTDPYQTPQQAAFTKATQQQLVAQLKATYPTFFALPADAQMQALATATSATLQRLPGVSPETQACHAGYLACAFTSATTGSGSGCQAFYNGCMGYLSDAQ